MLYTDDKQHLGITDTHIVFQDEKGGLFFVDWRDVSDVFPVRTEGGLRVEAGKVTAVVEDVVAYHEPFELWLFPDTWRDKLLSQWLDFFVQIIQQRGEVVIDDNDTTAQDQTLQGSLYPYDPTKVDVRIDTKYLSIKEFTITRYKEGKVIIPKFQRKFVWRLEQMSWFVESVLLNFPIHPLYVNQNVEGKYVVIDGLQRTTTLRRFLNNEFALRGLKALPKFNGCYFRDLIADNPIYQTQIEDHTLTIHVIPSSVPIQVVYDIFYRINAGGSPLSRQEIRNCIFQGAVTTLLDDLAEQPVFKQAIGYGISDKRMKDREAIMRYLAFKIQDYEKDYRGDMSDFVEEAMRKINIMGLKQETDKIEALKQDFERVMRLAYDFFGNRNFRFPTADTRGNINIAMLESIAYFFSLQSDEYLILHKQKIQENFNVLLKDELYKDAVRFSTGDRTRVRNRFEQVQKILGNV